MLCSLTLVIAWLFFSSNGQNKSGRADLAETRLVAGRLQNVHAGAGDVDGAYSESSRQKYNFGDDDDNDDASSSGYLSKQLGRWGSLVPGLGGWLGSKGTTRGHGQGDFGIETICEVGSGGTVKVHGYSDSVAKVSVSSETRSVASGEDHVPRPPPRQRSRADPLDTTSLLGVDSAMIAPDHRG